MNDLGPRATYVAPERRFAFHWCRLYLQVRVVAEFGLQLARDMLQQVTDSDALISLPLPKERSGAERYLSLFFPKSDFTPALGQTYNNGKCQGHWKQ